MKVSEYIIDFISRQGVKVIFGYQGGAITRIVDAIGKKEEMCFFSNYQEQGAAFAAEGYARITENIGVAIATSGPGTTNLITGIGSSFFDSVPVIYITGQVNSKEYKKSAAVRQVGFQETDIVSIVKPITKYARTIWQKEKILYYLQKAMYLAKEGRPGPVLLDIPMDVQNAEVNPSLLESYYESKEYKEKLINNKPVIDKKCVEEVARRLQMAKRPVILVGGGIRQAKAIGQLQEFVERTHIPVVSTLMGLDSLSHEQKEYVGFMGAYGVRYANLTVANADFILVLGARLTGRQISTKPESFARAATIIHVDIDENELGRAIEKSIQIHGDLKDFLEKLNKQIKVEHVALDLTAWQMKIESYKQKYVQNQFVNKVIQSIGSMLQEDAIICTDVVQNQIWTAQSMTINEKRRLLTSGGMGAMGFALPSAIGAWTGASERQVCVIAGDGGMQMNIQELQAVIREQIPLKIFVLNNRCLGMIRQFQEMYFESRYEGTMKGYSTPDFVALGNAYGITSMKIKSQKELLNIAPYLKDNKPYIFEVVLPEVTYVTPKLGMGRPIEDQEPLLTREELQEAMLIPLWDERGE